MNIKDLIKKELQEQMKAEKSVEESLMGKIKRGLGVDSGYEELPQFKTMVKLYKNLKNAPFTLPGGFHSGIPGDSIEQKVKALKDHFADMEKRGETQFFEDFENLIYDSNGGTPVRFLKPDDKMFKNKDFMGAFRKAIGQSKYYDVTNNIRSLLAIGAFLKQETRYDDKPSALDAGDRNKQKRRDKKDLERRRRDYEEKLYRDKKDAEEYAKREKERGEREAERQAEKDREARSRAYDRRDRMHLISRLEEGHKMSDPRSAKPPVGYDEDDREFDYDEKEPESSRKSSGRDGRKPKDYGKGGKAGDAWKRKLKKEQEQPTSIKQSEKDSAKNVQGLRRFFKDIYDNADEVLNGFNVREIIVLQNFLELLLKIGKTGDLGQGEALSVLQVAAKKMSADLEQQKPQDDQQPQGDQQQGLKNEGACATNNTKIKIKLKEAKKKSLIEEEIEKTIERHLNLEEGFFDRLKAIGSGAAASTGAKISKTRSKLAKRVAGKDSEVTYKGFDPEKLKSVTRLLSILNTMNKKYNKLADDFDNDVEKLGIPLEIHAKIGGHIDVLKAQLQKALQSANTAREQLRGAKKGKKQKQIDVSDVDLSDLEDQPKGTKIKNRQTMQQVSAEPVPRAKPKRISSPLQARAKEISKQLAARGVRLEVIEKVLQKLLENHK